LQRIGFNHGKEGGEGHVTECVDLRKDNIFPDVLDVGAVLDFHFGVVGRGGRDLRCEMRVFYDILLI
jgi:hypothetical protein